MIQALLSIVPNLLGMGADWLEGKRRVQQAQVESKLRVNEAVTNANIRLAEQGQTADITWATEMAKASSTSWKDEWFTVVLSIPAIMSFVPGLAPFVELGFHALNTTPEWYQLALLVAIGASFGVKLWGKLKGQNDQ